MDPAVEAVAAAGGPRARAQVPHQAQVLQAQGHRVAAAAVPQAAEAPAAAQQVAPPAEAGTPAQQGKPNCPADSTMGPRGKMVVISQPNFTNSTPPSLFNSSSSSIPPSYGGGKYYGGGATSPYRAGGRSPGAGIVPFALVGGIAGAALIFPGVWAYGAYNYPYSHPYSFHNRTNTSEPAGHNETLPVTCLCQMYSACGCDDNANSTYLDVLLGDGSPKAENGSLVHVGVVNGTKTVVLNGTLPNGTDTDSAGRRRVRRRGRPVRL